MRRSGKTTRAIDTAIQRLYELGKIYIPSKSDLEDRNKIKKIIEYCQIDPDSEKGFAQKDFKNRLLIRLKTEHNNQFVLKGNWIELSYEHNQ